MHPNDQHRVPSAPANVLDASRVFSASRRAHAGRIGGYALATRSEAILDLVARSAGFDSFQDAVAAAREGRVHGERPAWKRELGRLAFQFVEDDYATVARAFFDAALGPSSRLTFRSADSHAYLEAVLAVDGADAVLDDRRRHPQLTDMDWACVEADYVAANSGRPSPAWLDAVNEGLFLRSGLAPISLAESEGRLFDGLRSEVERRRVDGPLISVIMPTFRRRHEIQTAVRSILDQTWSNLELIISDDCSGPEFDDVFDALVRLDPRVRVLRMPSNGGAYASRNAALEIARGEFVTFQDDDDWSHPERLERQVKPLIDNDQVALSLSLSVRALEDLSFRFRGTKAYRKNASSLLFRRADIARVGVYDSVRKGADSEFIERLTTVTGGEVVTLDDVLAVVRLTQGSLSRSDFSVGWQHPSRTEYRGAFQKYHEELLWGANKPVRPGEARRFPAPRRFLQPAQLRDLPSHYGAAVLSDWRYVDYGSDAAWSIAHAMAGGDTWGVAHMPDLRLPGWGLQQVSPQVRSEIASARVARLLPSDDVGVGTLVVDDAALLELAARTPWSLRVERVVLVARDLPVELAPDAAWSLSAVTEAVEAAWRPSRIEWVASSPALQSALMDKGVESSLIDLRGVVLEAVVKGRRPHGYSHPRVGRFVRAAKASWESLIECTSAYPHDGDADVRLYSPAGAKCRLTSGWPGSWLTYGPTDIPFSTYLQQLDFYVLFGPDLDGPDNVLPALRAAVAGVVVIADPSLESQLGEAAVYCEAEDAATTIADLHGDPDAYRAQVERAQRWCTELRATLDTNAALRSLVHAG